MATISTSQTGSIYSITHVESGKAYVGQTWMTPKKRWQGHRSPYSGGGRSAIKAAIIKYGADAFAFSVVDTAGTQAELDAKEMHWIAALNAAAPCGYNLKAGGAHGRHSESTKAKIKEALRVRANGYVGKAKRKRLRSADEKAADRREQIRKIADAKRGNPAIWRWRPLVRNDGARYNTIKTAADAIGAHRATIHKHLKGLLMTVHGFTFTREEAA